MKETYDQWYEWRERIKAQPDARAELSKVA